MTMESRIGFVYVTARLREGQARVSSVLTDAVQTDIDCSRLVDQAFDPNRGLGAMTNQSAGLSIGRIVGAV
jgi:hypothetical protein